MKLRRRFKIDSEAKAELPNGNLMMLMRMTDQKPSPAQLIEFASRVAKRLIIEF